MAFDKYYQEELAYLREMGEVFADAYPKLAPFLAQKGHDPDVERLLEGFAFLTGRIRQKLDDELPELTHGMHALLWPHLLRPMPAATILQVTPGDNVNEKETIARDTDIDSVEVDGTACRFRTCYDVDLYPLSIRQIKYSEDGSSSIIKLSVHTDHNATLQQFNLDALRFYLHGDMQSSFTLYEFFFQYLSEITVQASGKADSGDRFVLSPDALLPVGFGEHEAMFPYPPNAFIGYRLLQEYFDLPHKFLFFDLKGLQPVKQFKVSDRFEIIFKFNRRIGDEVRVNKKSMLLYCTPIVNLFPKYADPIRLQHNKVEYRVRPASQENTHFEIYSIDKVEGWALGGRKRYVYLPYMSFDNSIDIDRKEANFFRLRMRPAVVGQGVDTSISFSSSGHEGLAHATTTVSIELTCTNRQLPEKLRVGDINVRTDKTPEFAAYTNILPTTPSTPPPLEKDLHWQLISNMSLNYISLADVVALRVILSTYNFPAYYNRQAARAHKLKMEGMRSIQLEPATTLFKGHPIHGYRTHLEMKSSNFSSEGEMYMFATILSEFFGLYASINSFNQLIVKDIDCGEVFRWKPKVGQQSLL